MAYTVPDPYPAAVRTGFGLSWRVDAYRAGVAVPGATGLVPDESNGGSIEDDATRDGRRTLDLGLPPTPGLFDLLAPIGTTLRVYADILYLNGSRATIPCGVYEVDAQSMGMVSGTVRINAPDKWARVKRARFLAPQTSTRGAPVTTQIAALFRGALGAGEAVNVTATSTATVGALVWDRDRDQPSSTSPSPSAPGCTSTVTEPRRWPTCPPSAPPRTGRSTPAPAGSSPPCSEAAPGSAPTTW
jgi:hypothetical protein